MLAGEGQLIVLGFRPFSLWGFRSRAISRGYPPGLRRMLGARRVADWLELLGYDVVADAQLSVHAALGRHRAASRRALGAAAPRLDQALARGRLPVEGAQARLHAHARSGREFRERAQPIGGLVKPTTRAAARECEPLSEVEIYTDGACRGNPGPRRLGRAAAVRRARARDLRRRSRDHQQPHGADGGDPRARGAQATGARAASTPIRSTCARACSSGCRSWKARGWKTADKKPVKNQDLWQALDALAQRHELEWHWVKGHSGNAGQRTRRRARESRHRRDARVVIRGRFS